MKKYSLHFCFLLALYFDCVFFGQVSLWGSQPDVTMAVTVSMAVLLGGMPAGIIGCILGLLIDLLLNPVIGISSIGYILGAAAGGIFCQKFYADNVIVPALTATAASFVKLHLTALAAALGGASIRYFESLPIYILPSAILTGLVTMPIFLLERFGAEERIRLRGSELHE